MNTLYKLTDLAAELGADIRLVQGAGGNVSLKDEATLWVKASGTWLADARQRMIFVPLNLVAVRAALMAGSDDFTAAIEDHSGVRPSIETSLHALMPQRVVVHVHSINALSWTVRGAGKALVAEKLNGLPWVWVDYVRPGLPLTRAVADTLATSPEATVLLLANHGLVVAADTPEDARALLDDVERRLLPTTAAALAWDDGIISALATRIPPDSRLPNNMLIHRLALDQDLIPLLDGALYPDHVIFLGSAIPRVSVTNYEALVDSLNAFPYCAAVVGEGVVLGEECSAGAEAMLECLALLAPCLPKKEYLRSLTLQEMAELSGWEAEKYRKNKWLKI